jgi:AcrR family transcriptional regulator
MSPNVRLGRDERHLQILNAALTVARQQGHYKLVERAHISEAAEVSPGLVSYYLGDMNGVRAAIVQHAIDCKDLKVLKQALLAGHPVALGAPEALKRKVAKSLGR